MEFLIALPIIIILAAVTKKISKAIGVNYAYVFITLIIWSIGFMIVPSLTILFLPFLLIVIWEIFIAIMKWSIKTLDEN